MPFRIAIPIERDLGRGAQPVAEREVEAEDAAEGEMSSAPVAVDRCVDLRRGGKRDVRGGLPALPERFGTRPLPAEKSPDL